MLNYDDIDRTDAPWRRDMWYRWYCAYLLSHEWAVKREEALARARGRCQGCGTREQLEAHHTTYVRVGYELPADVTVLCRACHQAEYERDQQRKMAKRRRWVDDGSTKTVAELQAEIRLSARR